MEMHDFYIGKAFDAYDYFGAHRFEKNGREGFVFRVYAPGAEAVTLIGEFNGWQDTPMEPFGTGGVYECFVENARAGMLYKYRIHQTDGRVLDRADPYGYAMELRPNSASVLVDLDYAFKDAAWLQKRAERPHYNEPMSIYEMHFGSWRRKAEEGPAGWYSYEALCGQLLDYVQKHGFTHVEFLPLTEYPADESWGYQVSGFYSATSRYGAPAELQYLIDTFHQAGIGVILDFVPVHFATNDYALTQFDGSALYEYPDADTGYSEWGSYNFNFYRGEVRSFLQSAAAFWIEKYHFDGLRMDAISNALYWQGDAARGANEGAVEFIQGMNEGLAERYPGVLRMAEDSTNFLKVTAPVKYGGLGFDYKWDMGWMNDTLNFMKIHPDDRKDHMGRLAFSMHYFYNELYMLPFSHDEVVHGKGTILDKMNGSYEEKFEQARLLYLYMFTHPGKKLNFMGNELGHFREWDEARELDWDLLKYPAHQEFFDYFSALNQFYKRCPALYENDYHSGCFSFVPVKTKGTAVLAYRRAAGGQELLTVLNFAAKPIEELVLELTDRVKIKEIFNTGNNSKRSAYELKTQKGSLMTKPHHIEKVKKTKSADVKPGAEHSYPLKMALEGFEGIVFEIIK